MKIFLSYGHDRNTPIVLRIKDDLEAAGHSIWIDGSQIKLGDDWRRSIVDGLKNTDWTMSFLSRHSVRDPGVCLDELAIALHLKAGAIATVLLEAEAATQTPVSISGIQWIDMHDWADRLANKDEIGDKWYREQLNEILAVLADPKNQRFAGEIEELDRLLRPVLQEAEIGTLVDGFVGREWLQTALDEWCKNARDSRLFWISGAPGTGKSAFAAWLAHKSRLNVIGVNFCRYNIEERRDPARVLRTLAFQIASRLADFRRLLLDSLRKQEAGELDKKEIPALFDSLLIQPLRFAIDGGRQRDRYLIVVDAMDETTRNGRSVLAEVLAEYCQYLPAWLGVVVTGRPEPSILRQFAGLKPQIITTESRENLEDCQAYVRRWLAVESLGGGETAARVERIVAASEGNFLYLRMLQQAVTNGFMDLQHPDGLPQGLVGLYERWFRRQFPQSAEYERIRPILEVLVAATHPLPEQWLQTIFGWSAPELAPKLECLGTLFLPTNGVGALTHQSWTGISPFHKSVRDWLGDPHSAGAAFVVDAANGTDRLIAALWPIFVSSIKDAKTVADLPYFATDELFFQLTRPQSDPLHRTEFVGYLAQPEFIRRSMRIDTDYNEGARRIARGLYENFCRRIINAWPPNTDATPLTKLPRELANVAWASMKGRLNDVQRFFDWLDVESHPSSIWEFKDWLNTGKSFQYPNMLPIMRHLFKMLTEWEMAILILLDAIRIAGALAKARPELISCLADVMDERMRDFIATGAHGAVGHIYQGTFGVDYLPDRNLSFLRSEAGETLRAFENDPRLSDWAKQWSNTP